MFEFPIKELAKQKVNFLHIGKTGGSAIKSVLGSNLKTSKYIIELHKHNVTIKDIPIGEQDDTTLLDIAKHRNGPTGQVELMFLRQHTRFVSKSNMDRF